MRKGRSISVARDSALFESVQRMHATARLNPYEREVLYGYPYVFGRQAGTAIRGPLLTMAVQIEPAGGGFVVHPADDVVRFNSLPFRPEHESLAHEEAISRIIAATPPFPVSDDALAKFVDVLVRELPSVERRARLDGRLEEPPEEPKSGEFLALTDQAGLFVAPKTSYFLTSDLERIAGSGGTDSGSLAPLIVGAGDEEPAEFTIEELDGTSIFYPFASNRSQRRVALLTDHPSTRVVRVEGPPGTGKSLTIANLACHLAATGRTVLITSQKDKALEVVDEMLRKLELSELPMTLLRHDKESKRDLMSRLDRIKKERGRSEVEQHYLDVSGWYDSSLATYVKQRQEYGPALESEARVEQSHREWQLARGLRRMAKRIRFSRNKARARRTSPRMTDEISEAAALYREQLRGSALDVLGIGVERRIATATRGERQQLRELSALLRRDQTKYRNFSLFDRLKAHPDWAERLLKLLPVWILTPDDAARLFPTKPGLFDVIIVDEASQVDLPSITPIAYRGKKLVIFGDTKQMQPRRFAFVAQQIAHQAWEQYEMNRLDPDGWLQPMKQSLLTLGVIRAEEENLLDEHFRSLPPIIQFSNERWYESELRVMTDERRKRFGGPDQPIIELHHVEDGQISNGSQENEREALALVDFLGKLVMNPDYSGASIGVICLFEEQVALIQDLVADRIDLEEWEKHDLVVVNPDGFQGDERDIILYSLSWDNKIMPRQALSQRQRDHPHEQGMLNVAFTRGRDELHVFHSAPIETFTKADGSAGAVTEWLRHCASVQNRPRPKGVGTRMGQIDSEFEGEVAAALEARGVRVLHQYPACGFNIDLVCEMNSKRIAVECDGWTHHTDAHGRLKIEDLERQAILERAGWRVVRIPYRKWLADPDSQVLRVVGEFERERADGGQGTDGQPPRPRPVTESPAKPTVQRVTSDQKTILQIVGEGVTELDEVLGMARKVLGHKRLGKKIRESLLFAAQDLNHRGLIVLEDGECFLTPLGRSATIEAVPATTPPRPEVGHRGRKRGSHKTVIRSRSADPKRCSCGGRWVLRTGKYGRFYGCSRFPYCRRTRSFT